MKGREIEIILNANWCLLFADLTGICIAYQKNNFSAWTDPKKEAVKKVFSF